MLSHEEIVDLPIHELASNYPSMTEEERRLVKASIAEVGLRSPLLWMFDEDGHAWLIDGINRRKIVLELLSEGLEVAANGEPIALFAEQFVGTEVEGSVRVTAANLDRRHLTSIQRAAVGVKQTAYEERLHAKCNLDYTRGNPDALARMYATNAHYITDCMRYFADSRELFDSVMNGTTGAGEARVAFKRAAKAADEVLEKTGKSVPIAVDLNDTEEIDPKPRPTDSEIKDGQGNYVAKEFADIFAARVVARRIKDMLMEVAGLATQFADSPGGGTCDKSMILADLRTMRVNIENCQPYIVCVCCEGVGFVDELLCKQCKGLKYFDKMQAKISKSQKQGD